MDKALITRMKAIAMISPPMPSTSHLKSADWTHVQLRSLRRAGIHQQRVRKINKDVMDYFGRWKTDKKEAMQIRYGRLSIQENVGASAAMQFAG